MTGPFSKDDFLYHNTIIKDEVLEKFEKGIIAPQLLDALADNRYTQEYKVKK